VSPVSPDVKTTTHQKRILYLFTKNAPNVCEAWLTN